ncbi:MAG TPA: hypothetical protein V6C78_32335 [Crinalium sp.]|jgi:hypothetical protein
MHAIYTPVFSRFKWKTIVVFALIFWLSSSLLLDLVVMPELYSSGMMAQPDFAVAGYSIFWVFNRVELICAALVLTGVLVLQRMPGFLHRRTAIAFSTLLLGIALTYTYVLTPEMSALGLQLDLFNPASTVPGAMDLMHQGYWGLEVLKLVVAGALLSLNYKPAA